jgi:hypothetical protein
MQATTNNTIKKLIANYIKKYGYAPSVWGLYDLYASGALSLTDKQENELLKYFEANGIN